MKSFTCLLVLVLMPMTSFAAPRHSSAEILRDVKKLSVVGTALYVAAHPDDENTRLLASLANDTKVRTAYLSLTRGEGGQNLIGREIGPLLGVIRTQELLAARRIDGAEQYFTSARDFGYSKSVDETLRIWNKQQVLRDAVRLIRDIKPDVIIARFAQEGGDTHGHHTASARIALEAFTAAADPKFVIEGTTPWQATRVVWNAWSRDPGEPAFATPPLKWNSGAFDPLLGVSYGEMAADSRSMHKSQGFGAAPAHGPMPELFVPLAGTPGTSLFDGVDLTWKRVRGAEKVAALLKEAADGFNPRQPAASVPTLLKALEAMRAVPDHPYKALKLTELVNVIADCAGLFTEATANDFTAVPGGALEVTTTALNRTSAELALRSVTVTGAEPFDAAGAKLVDAVANTHKFTVKVPENARLTTPRWLEREPDPGNWVFDDETQVNAPEAPPALTADFTFVAQGGVAFTVNRPVTYKWTDPTAGERYRAVEIVPPVTVKADASLMLFTTQAEKPLRVTVTAMADNQEGMVHLAKPNGALPLNELVFELAKKGDTIDLVTDVPATMMMLSSASAYQPKVTVSVKNRTYGTDLKRIDYPHIPIQVVQPEVVLTPVKVDLKRGAVTKVGYIAGAGDEVAELLRQVGYQVTLLDDETVRTKPLNGYDAIVVGVRAYNVNPRLGAAYAALMKYVADGGTLVAQYNTKNWLSNVPARIGPYAFEVTQDRVTDERAEVKFDPKHRVTTAPNKLTADDFHGWVQERGLYFAGHFDDRYQTPFSMNDAGEVPKVGGVIIAKHGKGTFVYTGLSFFRQLPAGVPGAYRLFANLLAANGR